MAFRMRLSGRLKMCPDKRPELHATIVPDGPMGGGRDKLFEKKGNQHAKRPSDISGMEPMCRQFLQVVKHGYHEVQDPVYGVKHRNRFGNPPRQAKFDLGYRVGVAGVLDKGNDHMVGPRAMTFEI